MMMLVNSNKLQKVQGFVVLCSLLLLLCCTRHAGYKENSSLTPAKFNSLGVEAELFEAIDPGQVKLNLKVINGSKYTVHIKEISLSTVEGIRSAPLNVSISDFQLTSSKDSLLQLIFDPLNDLSLYQLTGIHGALKSEYKLSVLYTMENEDDERIVTMTILPAEKVSEEHGIENGYHVTPYVFNTNSEFPTRQSEYCKNELVGVGSFCHVSEQEIALSGLNIRMQAYQKNDNLHVKLLLINHATFFVRIDTAALNIIANNNIRRKISVQRVSGDGTDNTLLQPGDRIEVLIEKHFNRVTDEACFITFRKSIMLKEGKPLFVQDVALVKMDMQPGKTSNRQ